MVHLIMVDDHELWLIREALCLVDAPSPYDEQNMALLEKLPEPEEFS
jgi:hypothetical protein